MLGQKCKIIKVIIIIIIMKCVQVGVFFLTHVSTKFCLIKCSEEFSFTSITCRSTSQRDLHVGSNPAEARWHGFLAVVNYVFCQVEGPATGRLLFQTSPTYCGVWCVCVCVCVGCVGVGGGGGVGGVWKKGGGGFQGGGGVCREGGGLKRRKKKKKKKTQNT